MSAAGGSTVLDRSAFPALLDALVKRGYTVVGPTLRDGAIVYDELRSEADLPIGWTDEQEGGTYRLKRRDDEALFGYAVGPQSWKQFLFPPSSHLWTAKRTDGGFDVQEEPQEPPRHAFLGARACELQAVAVQDRVFLEGRVSDPTYRARREGIFVVAVQCGQAARTCFCASMGTGPKASFGFDIALTELVSQESHRFLVGAGSYRGRDLLAELPCRPARAEDEEEARQAVARAEEQMVRRMDPEAGKILARNYEHPRWDEVAARCLACANCAMVCPTCFCSTVEDVTDLTGDHAERWRTWDSCFTQDFSHIHGGPLRPSTRARYRQWLTHKLSTWHEQFGSSGCVGCGRCITWCPVGIDITEEVRTIREAEDNAKED